MGIKYESGFVLFACTEDDQAVNDAKKYCKENDYTQDQVQICRRENIICVVVK